MRTLQNATLVVVIPVAEFVAIRRIGLNGGAGVFLIFVTMIVLLVWVAKQDSRASQLRLQNGAETMLLSRFTR